MFKPVPQGIPPFPSAPSCTYRDSLHLPDSPVSHVPPPWTSGLQVPALGSHLWLHLLTDHKKLRGLLRYSLWTKSQGWILSQKQQEPAVISTDPDTSHALLEASWNNPVFFQDFANRSSHKPNHPHWFPLCCATERTGNLRVGEETSKTQIQAGTVQTAANISHQGRRAQELREHAWESSPSSCMKLSELRILFQQR